MPRLRTRTRPTRESTRAAVLDCAQTLFAEKGFHRTTVEDIAAAAGFSRGAVYSSFPNKEQVFLALLRRRLASQAEIVAAAVTAAPPGARAQTLGRTMADFAAREPGWTPLLMEFWAYALRDSALKAELATLRREVRAAAASTIPDVRGPTPAHGLGDTAIALLIFALANGLGMEWATDSAAFDPTILPLTIERLLAGPANSQHDT